MSANQLVLNVDEARQLQAGLAILQKKFVTRINLADEARDGDDKRRLEKEKVRLEGALELPVKGTNAFNDEQANWLVAGAELYEHNLLAGCGTATGLKHGTIATAWTEEAHLFRQKTIPKVCECAGVEPPRKPGGRKDKKKAKKDGDQRTIDEELASATATTEKKTARKKKATKKATTKSSASRKPRLVG